MISLLFIVECSTFAGVVSTPVIFFSGMLIKQAVDLGQFSNSIFDFFCHGFHGLLRIFTDSHLLFLLYH